MRVAARHRLSLSRQSLWTRLIAVVGLYATSRCAGEIAVGFFTTEFVPAGTELTFNYNFERYSDKTIPCSCGAKSCTGFIGGDASAKQLELRSESEEEMEGDENGSPKKTKKIVQRDLLGRAITKKKEEKEWAPGMAEGWSSEEEMSEGEQEDNAGPTRGKKRKSIASGSRKRQKSSSGSSSRVSERERWKKEHPDHTPFDLELWEMCDSASHLVSSCQVPFLRSVSCSCEAH